MLAHAGWWWGLGQGDLRAAVPTTIVDTVNSMPVQARQGRVLYP